MTFTSVVKLVAAKTYLAITLRNTGKETHVKGTRRVK